MANAKEEKVGAKMDVKLLKPHTHDGRDYPLGAVIRGMDKSSAEWLIAIGTAEKAPPETGA